MKKIKRGYCNWKLDRNSARDSSPFDVVDFEEASKEVGVEAAGIETPWNGSVHAQCFKIIES